MEDVIDEGINGLRGRPATITYELVDTVIRQLTIQEGSYSCAAVRAVLGKGSMSTIHKYVQKWREENLSFEQKPIQLSSKFLSSINTEISTQVTEIVARYKLELQIARADTEMMSRELEDMETRWGECEIFSQAQKANIIELNATTAKQATREAHLQTEILELRQNLLRAEIRLENFNRLEQQLMDAMHERDKQVTIQFQLKSDLAVATATCVQLNTRLNEMREAKSFRECNVTSTSSECDPVEKEYQCSGPTCSAMPQAGSQQISIVELAYAVLTQTGPMSTKSILNEMAARGLDVRSAKALTGVLGQSRVFEFNRQTSRWAAVSTDRCQPTQNSI